MTCWSMVSAAWWGGLVWASVFGTGGYVLGDNVERFVGPVGLATAALVAILTLTAVILVRRHEQRLANAAERALPGPLDAPRDVRACVRRPASGEQSARQRDAPAQGRG